MFKYLLSATFILLVSFNLFAKKNVATRTTASTPAEIKKIYSDYKIKKEAFLRSKLSADNLKTDVENYLRLIDANYDAITAIESKNSDADLTVEGNQMAYDRELLQPLIDLSQKIINCEQAIHNSRLNTDSSIETLIKNICKK